MTVQVSERALEPADLRTLFKELVDDNVGTARRAQIRERLIAEYLPVAERIAGKYRNRGQSQDDLLQIARIGLINAVDRFDPGRGTDFLAFAVPTITGEVRRYFRDSTWAVRVPRRLKELHAAITQRTEAGSRPTSPARPTSGWSWWRTGPRCIPRWPSCPPGKPPLWPCGSSGT